MNDYHVPLWGVLAGIGWLVAIALLIAGWVLTFEEDQPNLGIMFGLTAVFASTVSVSLTSQFIAGAVMTRLDRGEPD